MHQVGTMFSALGVVNGRGKVGVRPSSDWSTEEIYHSSAISTGLLVGALNVLPAFLDQSESLIEVIHVGARDVTYARFPGGAVVQEGFSTRVEAG